MCEVTFIDDKGNALLAEMHQHGAELVAEGCMNSAIVEEIKQGGRSMSEYVREVNERIFRKLSCNRTCRY